MDTWLNDNPDLTIELLNRCGYWYFPKSLEVAKSTRSKLDFTIGWLNKGVAPAYSSFRLKGKFMSDDDRDITVEFEIEDSGNRNWMPGEIISEFYTINLNNQLKGRYKLAIQLFDEKSGRHVEIGLKEETIDNQGYYLIGEFLF